MVVLSLFDGISCGQLALQRAGIKVNKYYASEIDKDAIKVTQANFPNTIQIGDVYNVHYKDGKLITDKGDFEVSNVDLLIGGSACFTAGNLVLTRNGYKDIKNIIVGEEVLTQEGRYKKVTCRFVRKSNDIWAIKVDDCEEIIATGNHPFYVCSSISGNPTWKELARIPEDALVGCEFHKAVNWKSIVYIKKLNIDIPQTVYNLEVEDDHTYVVNGVYVHNCQNLCVGGDNLGLKGAKSSIFFEFLRLRNEVKPKYWLLENVRCANKWRDVISEYLGVHPRLINSELVSFQSRPRYYWSNMKFGQPEDKHINFQDYKEEVSPEDISMFNKSACNLKAYRLTINKEKAKYRYQDVTNETKTHTVMCKKDRPWSSVVMCNGFMRALTQRELELAQTLPVGYTSMLSYHPAHKVIGNGWTVDVIAHIFKEGLTNANCTVA